MRALLNRVFPHATAIASLLAGSAAAQELPAKDAFVAAPAAEWAPAGATTMPNGMRKANSVERVAASATPREAGKTGFASDPKTGEMLVPTTRFFLPDNWNWGGGDPYADPTDSLGRPIVSAPLGWTAWSQADVDGLRAAIAKYRALADQGGTEAEAAFGNFAGQAVVRGIDVADLQLATLPATAARGVMERMSAYEQTKFETSLAQGIAYEPTVYGESVQQFVAAQGMEMAQVLAVEEPPMGSAGSRTTPSGCYFRQPGNGYGLNLLVNPTIIWQASDNADDVQADVPIGFPFHFYECQDGDLNTAVRVSSNGYVSFFQQGGGATNGVEYVNVPIGNATSPNGMVAGYWDDLVVVNQSNIADQVSWKIEGSYASRVLIIEYLSVSRLGGDADDYHTFQILLHEYRSSVPGYSPITLGYGEPVTYWQADSIDLATIGLEGFKGTDGECIETCDLQPGLPPQNYIYYPLRNDECEDARPLLLAVGAYQTTDLRFAYSSTAACGVSNPDRWFYFTAPCTGTLTVRTCGTNDFGGVDQGIDTILSAHSSCPGGGGVTLGCDDDGGTDCEEQGNVRDSRLALNVQGGQTIYVRVTSFSAISSLGYVALWSEFVSSGEHPANDNCPNAIPLDAVDSVAGNLLCATIDGHDSQNFDSRDVWYSYSAPLAGTLRITTCGTHDLTGIDWGIDSVISIHSGCPGTPANELAVNDDAPNGTCGDDDFGYEFDAMARAHLGAGQTARVRIHPLGEYLKTGEYRLQSFFLTADIDGDCDVDLQDLAYLLSDFGQAGPNLQGDIDGNSVVSLQDLAHVLSNFGFSCP